jgi:hypothetical protein
MIVKEAYFKFLSIQQYRLFLSEIGYKKTGIRGLCLPCKLNLGDQTTFLFDAVV